MQAKIVILTSRVALLLLFLASATWVTPSVHSGQADTSDPAQKDEQKPSRPIELPGSLVPFEQVDVYTKIMAFVDAVFVDIGDRVKKGQLLAKLAAPELKQELNKKKALVQKAQIGIARAKQAALVLAAAVELSRAEMDVAKAALIRSEVAVNRWKAEYERVKKLRDKGIIDGATIDEVLNQWKTAQADEVQAKAKIKKAEAMQKEAEALRDQGAIGIELAQADFQAAQADAEVASLWLQYTEIRAPFDGVVTQRFAHAGQFVRPPSGDKSEPLFTVVRIDRMRVVIDVPEVDAPWILMGAKATVRVKALQEEFKGTVARTAWGLDPKARTLRVEVDLPNPDGKLRPNMYATVTILPKTAEPKKKE